MLGTVVETGTGTGFRQFGLLRHGTGIKEPCQKHHLPPALLPPATHTCLTCHHLPSLSLPFFLSLSPSLPSLPSKQDCLWTFFLKTPKAACDILACVVSHWEELNKNLELLNISCSMSLSCLAFLSLYTCLSYLDSFPFHFSSTTITGRSMLCTPPTPTFSFCMRSSCLCHTFPSSVPVYGGIYAPLHQKQPTTRN